MTTTTSQIVVRASTPLQAVNLANVPDELAMMVARAFPDVELDDEQRNRKALALLDEAQLYVETSPAKAKGPLKACTLGSVIESVSGLASMNLSLRRSLGHAALVPFSNICTLMLQYQGFAELILRTETVSSIQTEVVYKDDEFAYELGDKPWLKHKPNIRGARGDNDIIAAYSLAHHVRGPISIEVMDLAELKKVEAASKQKSGIFYRDWKRQMYRKAPLRRQAKYLRKMVGGTPQLMLARALEMEDAQFDNTRLKRLGALAESHQLEMADRVAGAVDKPLQKVPDEAMKKRQATRGQNKGTLLARVAALRKDSASGLTDTEFVQQVVFNLLGKNQIDSQPEFDDVWDAIITRKAYTWDDATLIPEENPDG